MSFRCKVIVEVCPDTKEDWEARAKIANCGYDDKIRYHCLSDSLGRKWEKCMEKTLIDKGNCPMLTTDEYIDWKPCTEILETSCPNSSYVSNEVYKYPMCFDVNTPAINQTLQVADNAGLHDFATWLFIGVAVPTCILLIIGAAILFLVIRRRQSKKSKALYHVNHEKRHLLAGKEKIHVVGTARKQVVHAGLETLLIDEVKSLIVTGVIGNSATTTSRFISKKSAKRMKWKQKEYVYNELPNNVEDKTIILVHGWFGLWNDDLCSFKTAQKACETLGNILKDKQNVKVIIEMKTNVYEKYHLDLEKDYPILFQHVSRVDSTAALPEYRSYFDKVMRLCKNPECECKRLTTDMLRTGKDPFVGMLLKINIIRNHHDCDLIKNYIEHGHDILKVMTDLIASLKGKNEAVYGCLAYICLKGHFSVCDTLNEEILNKIGPRITRASFDDEELKKFVQNGENGYVFWNPFIYICAFHALYKEKRDIIMNHCNFDAIFQLLRPAGTPLSYIEVSADDESIEMLQKRIEKIENETKTDLLERYGKHPLFEKFKATN